MAEVSIAREGGTRPIIAISQKNTSFGLDEGRTLQSQERRWFLLQ